MRAIIHYIYALYGWLPALIAIVSAVGSGLVAWRQRSLVHACLTLVVCLLSCWALFTLYRIFFLDEANLVVISGRVYRNYLPHFAIFVAFTIFACQGFYSLCVSSDAT